MLLKVIAVVCLEPPAVALKKMSQRPLAIAGGRCTALRPAFGSELGWAHKRQLHTQKIYEKVLVFQAVNHISEFPASFQLYDVLFVIQVMHLFVCLSPPSQFRRVLVRKRDLRRSLRDLLDPSFVSANAEFYPTDSGKGGSKQTTAIKLRI